MLRVCFKYHETYIVCKSVPIHLGVACWKRCVMQHCFSLVSSVLRCQLTAVLGDSFVLFPYLCAHCNSGTSHPTCSPHPPSLYIKLNLRTTSGSAEVGYICLTTHRGDGEVGGRFAHNSVLCKINSWEAKTFICNYLKITVTAVWTTNQSTYTDMNNFNSFYFLARDTPEHLGWLCC